MKRYHLIDTATGEIKREFNSLPRPRSRRPTDVLDIKLIVATGVLLGLLVGGLHP